MLLYALFRRHECFLSIIYQKDITINPMITKTMTNPGKKPKKMKQKFEKKVPKTLNHNFFSGSFNDDPLDVFFKPMGTANTKITR